LAKNANIILQDAPQYGCYHGNVSLLDETKIHGLCLCPLTCHAISDRG